MKFDYFYFLILLLYCVIKDSLIDDDNDMSLLYYELYADMNGHEKAKVIKNFICSDVYMVVIIIGVRTVLLLQL
jgi:hypothetical protein